MPSVASRRTAPRRLTLTILAPRNRGLTRFLDAHLRAAHQMLRCPLRELSIALVSDAEMARLHERFMSIAGPTDVLTFPLETDRAGRPISGEVVICLPEARRRGKELNTELRDEVLLYAVHGLFR